MESEACLAAESSQGIAISPNLHKPSHPRHAGDRIGSRIDSHTANTREHHVLPLNHPQAEAQRQHTSHTNVLLHSCPQYAALRAWRNHWVQLLQPPLEMDSSSKLRNISKPLLERKVLVDVANILYLQSCCQSLDVELHFAPRTDPLQVLPMTSRTVGSDRIMVRPSLMGFLRAEFSTKNSHEQGRSKFLAKAEKQRREALRQQASCSSSKA